MSTTNVYFPFLITYIQFLVFGLKRSKALEVRTLSILSPMGLLLIYTCGYIWMIWKHGRDTRKYLFISWPRDTNCRVPILHGILTKLGTYLDLKRIWNLIDFQGQRSRSQGLIFRLGDTPRLIPLLDLTVRTSQRVLI
jgi:hypothetical protein